MQVPAAVQFNGVIIGQQEGKEHKWEAQQEQRLLH